MVVVGPPGVGKRHHVQVALQQSSELQRHCIVTDLRQRPTSFDAFLRTFEQRAADALENYVASGAIASPELAKLCAAAGATPSDASAALHSIAARLQAEGRPLAATLDAMDSDESGILYGLCQLGDSAARRAQRAPPRPPLAAPEAAQQLREIAARCVSAARSATADDNGWLADLLNSASNACSRPATRGSSGLSITAAAISILRCVEERRCRRLQAAAADAATAAATALTATTATTATTAVEAVAAPGAGTDVRLEAREGREALAARLARRGGSGGRSGIAVQQFLLEALSCVAAGGRIMPHRREQADEAMLPGSQWQEDFSVQVPPHTPSPKLAVLDADSVLSLPGGGMRAANWLDALLARFYRLHMHPALHGPRPFAPLPLVITVQSQHLFSRGAWDWALEHMTLGSTIAWRSERDVRAALEEERQRAAPPCPWVFLQVDPWREPDARRWLHAHERSVASGQGVTAGDVRLCEDPEWHEVHARLGGHPAHLVEFFSNWWRPPPRKWESVPVANGYRPEYYYHVDTLETRWSLPEEEADAIRRALDAYMAHLHTTSFNPAMEQALSSSEFGEPGAERLLPTLAFLQRYVAINCNLEIGLFPSRVIFSRPAPKALMESNLLYLVPNNFQLAPSSTAAKHFLKAYTQERIRALPLGQRMRLWWMQATDFIGSWKPLRLTDPDEHTFRV